MKQQKTDHRSQRMYQLVSTAFTDRLSEKPYAEILGQDIVDRADTGRIPFSAHNVDTEEAFNSMTEQMRELFRQQVAHSPTRKRIVPDLELFEHVYQSPQRHFRALMQGHTNEHLWGALHAGLCRTIEPALANLCIEKRSPPIPLLVVSEYLASTFITLLKWWLSADMPYPPEQMESIFQQLALPGAWAMLKEK